MTTLLRTAFLALSLYTGHACASQQQDLDKLRARIAALQKDFDKANDSRSEAADALRDSERAISDSNRALDALAQQQRAAHKELQALQQRTATAQAEIQGQQALLGRLLYQQYLEGGDQDYLRLLLNNDDPNQVARDLHYYEYIARGRAMALRSMRDSVARLQAVTDQARAKSVEIAALQADERQGLQQLEHDKRERQHTLDRIAQQLGQQRREIGRLQRNESRLSQLVEKLAHVLPGTNTAPFQSLKGKLAMPVNGKVSNRFGAKRPESTLAWTGWFVRASARQPVKTVAGGRVVYADWLRGFGNLLIVDHGQGYLSLYGNNETLYKQVGDTLRAGDTVAAVGSSGGNEDSGLYFELRFEGKPFDPGKWIKHR